MSLPRIGTRPHAAALVLVLFLLGAAACAVLQRDGDAGEVIVVRVENQNTNNVTLYALHLSARVRMGMVTALRTQYLHTRPGIPGQVQFEVDVFAGRSFTTDPISAWPGDTVVVQVPARLR